MITSTENEIIAAMPLGPNAGERVVTQSATEPSEWLMYSLRGLDLPPRGDGAFVNAGLIPNLSAGDQLAHLAVLIERARQAERAAVLAELAPADAVAEIAERIRAEGHAAGRTEAAAEARTVLAEHREQVAKDRRRQAWLWAQLQESFGVFEA